MNRDIEIRACKDAALICTLNTELQDLHHEMYPEHFKKHNFEALLPAFDQMLAQDNCQVYVAWKEKESLGYILLFVRERAESAFQYQRSILHLDQIFVKERFRTLGVGAAFMAHIKALALEMGVDCVQLDHWTANKRARRFFQKSGFTYFNERMEYAL